jgi:ABC-type branched-subunit amino acid transport system ATPase component
MSPATPVEFFPAPRPLKDRKAGLMSGGEQQMLAISPRPGPQAPAADAR